MHSIAEIGSNVPAFLGKLWKMVEDPETNDLIMWSSAGTSFVIKDEIRFARDLLPMYYKHNNMASFIRQLNMYGFHKIVSPEAGSMKLETIDEVKFTHPYFMRGHPYLLENIKRKIGVNKGIPGQLGERTPQVINKVLTDVKQMKGRQESMESRLTAMKMENGALWRELSVLRQKHIKQQQIVNKLIQFLVTIMHQNHSSFSVKRSNQRMLQHHKSPSKAQHDDDETASNFSKSPLGPIIHELDPAEALLETVVEEAESAEADSPSEITDYYLGQSGEGDEEETIEVEMPRAFEGNKSNDVKVETIVGMPDDSLLVPNSRTRPPQNISIKTQRSVPLYATTKIKKEPELLRPKLVKLIRPTRKPKIEIENLQGVPQQQQQVKNIQQRAEKNLKLQIKANQQQIEKNQKQIERSQQEVKEQQQVLKSQQNQLFKNQKHLLKNKYRLHSNKVQLQQKHLQTPQSQSDPQQTIVLPGLVQQAQSSLPVISIPFDSSIGETILPDVDTTTAGPVYVENRTEQLGVPVMVEILDGSPAQVQASPTPVSPQDLLLGSPLVINDPVMTPQCESVVTPVATPSEASSSPLNSSDMQVACVQEEPQVTSPSLVTRNEMDSHLDSVQSDLDHFKELLRSEGISLDANALLGFFNDDPLSYNISDSVIGEESDRLKENSGNELVAYNPATFDFADLIGNEWNLPSPSENVPTEETFPEVNTPQFVPQSPSFPVPAKKRKN